MARTRKSIVEAHQKAEQLFYEAKIAVNQDTNLSYYKCSQALSKLMNVVRPNSEIADFKPLVREIKDFAVRHFPSMLSTHLVLMKPSYFVALPRKRVNHKRQNVEDLVDEWKEEKKHKSEPRALIEAMLDYSKATVENDDLSNYDSNNSVLPNSPSLNK